MLSPRVIPCLLIHNGGLVKTINFADPKYVGDPLNAVRIFNEKQVDELFVLDIDRSVSGEEPDYDLIKNLASECRMPLCYGGGIKTAEQASRIVSLGVEKIAVSSAAIDQPELVAEISDLIGSQSTAVVIDIRTDGGVKAASLWTHNGARRNDTAPLEFANNMERQGAGEIVVNNISRDGKMNGYDLEIARTFRDNLGVPVTMIGGAGSANDINELISKAGIVGAAAGSLFVFKGKYRAVLISYLSPEQKQSLTF